MTFIVVNLCGGYFVYNDHKNYKGKILTDADINLNSKTRPYRIYIEDWRKNSNDEIIKVGYGFLMIKDKLGQQVWRKI